MPNTFTNVYTQNLIVNLINFLERCFYVYANRKTMIYLTVYTTHLATIKDGHFKKVTPAKTFSVQNNKINQCSDISLLL